MVHNLLTGSVLVTLSVLIHTGGLILIAGITPPLARWFGFHNHDVGRTLVMTGTVLGILCILTLEIWSWALAYAWLGVTKDFGEIRLKDHTGHVIRVLCKLSEGSRIPSEHEQVVVVEYDDEKSALYVTPLDEPDQVRVKDRSDETQEEPEEALDKRRAAP